MRPLPAAKPATLIVTRGLPGSGKTSWARYRLASIDAGALVRVNRDDLRRMMLRTDYRKPVRTQEQWVSILRDTALRELLGAGISVIVDDTNLNPTHVRRMFTIARSVGATWRVQDSLHVPLDLCVLRDHFREGTACVGKNVILDMHAEFIAPLNGEPMPIPEPE